MTEKKRTIAPDIVSDVAEWGYRKVLGKDIKDMTAEELAKAEADAKKLPPLPHMQDRP
jgi:hypothetical protein